MVFEDIDDVDKMLEEEFMNQVGSVCVCVV